MRNPRKSPSEVTKLEQSGIVEEANFLWSVHLSAGQPKRQAQIAAVLLGVFVLGVWLFRSVWLGLAPMLALLFSLSEYIFPIQYTLTPQSASARHGFTMLEIRWADVRHAYITEDGIKLSPLSAKNSRFESLRGVFLRFGNGNRDAIIEAVRRFRTEAADGE